MEMNQNNLFKRNKYCTEIITQLPDFFLLENKMQKIQNDIQSKIFEMSKIIEENTQLESKENTFKNEISNVRKKIIETAIVENNADLYKKILSISKETNSEIKESEISKITNNNEKNPKKQTKETNKSLNLTKMNKLKAKKENKYRKIEHRFLVYDSMDDDENIDNSNSIGYSISPNSYFILIYDVILTAITLYNCFEIPLALTYKEVFCVVKPFSKNLIIYFSELLFILDIFVSFFRGYYNDEYEIILNNKKIILHYLRYNFIFDLYASIPYFYIYSNLCKKIDFKSRILKLPITSKEILIKLVIITKLLKIKKIEDPKNNRALELLYEKLSEIYYLENLFGLTLTNILILLTTHITVCLHIFFGELSYPNWENNSILVNNKTFLSKYISSLYFIVTTITSVGYGDIVCISFAERIFQIFLLAVGLIAYSFIITKFGNYIREENKQKIILEEKENYLEELRKYYPKMSFKLYLRIRNYLKIKYKKNKKNLEINILINNLPDKLRNTMLFTVYDKIVKNFNIFKNCQNSNFILETLNCFVKIVVRKETILIKEGDLINEIYFVHEGRLALEAIVDLNDPLKSLQKYILINFGDIQKEKEENLESFSQNSLSNNLSNFINNRSINDYNSYKRQISLLLNKINVEDGPTLSNIEKNNTNSISDENNKLSISEKDKEIKEISDKNIILKILDIRKNESFGGVYLLLEKPAPLTLRVKSRFSEVFILRKKDAMNIYKSNQNIMKKITKKSYHNLVSIKKLTYKNIKKICLLNGFDQDINKFVSTNTLNSLRNSSIFFTPRNIQNSIIPKSRRNSNFFIIRQSNTNKSLFNKMKLNNVNSKNSNRRSSNFVPHVKYCLNKSNKNLTRLKSCLSNKSNRNKPANKKVIFAKPSLYFQKKSLFNQKKSSFSNPGLIHVKQNIAKKNLAVINNEKENNIYKFLHSDCEVQTKLKNKKTYNFKSDDKINLEMKSKTPSSLTSSLTEHKNELYKVNNNLEKTIEKRTTNITNNDSDKTKVITSKDIKKNLSKKITKKIKRNIRYKKIKKLWEYQKYLLSDKPEKDKMFEESFEQNELQNIDKTNIDGIFNKLLESDSESDDEESNINNYSSYKNLKDYNNNLKCDNNISFNINSSYKNINELSKGKIIKNNKFSKNILHKIKTFIKIEKQKCKTKSEINFPSQLRTQTNLKLNKEKNQNLLNEYSLNNSPFILNDDISSIDTIQKEINEEDSSIFDTFNQEPLYNDDKNYKKETEYENVIRMINFTPKLEFIQNNKKYMTQKNVNLLKNKIKDLNQSKEIKEANKLKNENLDEKKTKLKNNHKKIKNKEKKMQKLNTTNLINRSRNKEQDFKNNQTNINKEISQKSTSLLKYSDNKSTQKKLFDSSTSFNINNKYVTKSDKVKCIIY